MLKIIVASFFWDTVYVYTETVCYLNTRPIRLIPIPTLSP